MPELPEVETIRRSLALEICGETISSVKVNNASLRSPIDCQALEKGLTGRRVIALDRSGKVLILRLSGAWTWIVHFGMTGKLVITPATAPLESHTHVQVELKEGRELRFVDPRRFGQMAAIPARKTIRLSLIANLGLDPMSKFFNLQALASLCRGRVRKIRDLIMDQRCIAGLGNIYAHEILHHAGIRPDRTSGSLNPKELRRLVDSTKTILRLAIRHRGTSIRNYVDAKGQGGSHQKFLKVYQRNGLPCLRCGSRILLIRGGRSSFYCPACQT